MSAVPPPPRSKSWSEKRYIRDGIFAFSLTEGRCRRERRCRSPVASRGRGRRHRLSNVAVYFTATVTVAEIHIRMYSPICATYPRDRFNSNKKCFLSLHTDSFHEFYLLFELFVIYFFFEKTCQMRESIFL